MAILLSGATLWDGLADSPAGRRDVLVENDRIIKVDNRIDAPEGTSVVDLSGHTITPGFMDCHTHVTITPDLVSSVALSPTATVLRALPVLRTLLMNGFTTVRDLISRIQPARSAQCRRRGTHPRSAHARGPAPHLRARRARRLQLPDSRSVPR